MFKWLEKIVIKRIIKKVKDKLPKTKEKALEYWEANKDEITDKLKDKAKEIIMEKIKG